MLRLLASLCLAFACVSAQAATFQMVTAASSEFATVYAGAVTGDTIKFPLNGSATWSTSATVSKALTIDGNGTTLTQGATLNNGFFYVTGFTSSSLMRITGFTLNAVNFTPSRTCITMNSVDLSNARIDHNTFVYGYTGLVCYGVKGVVDSNTFTNCLKGIDYSAGSVAQATASWVSMAAGTSDALFIETNTFLYNASYPGTGSQEGIGTENGGKLVIRYNTWTATLYPASDTITPIMTHGSAAGGVANGYWEIGTGARRGQSVVEIYNNTITGARVDFLCILRGSANLIHDNVLNCTVNPPRVILREEEGEDPQWNPLRVAWPAEDQVHNSFFWNNTLNLNGVPNVDYVEVYADSSATFIHLDRDYFLHAPQSSGGSESFTSSNGAAGSYPTNGSPWPNLGTMTFSSSGANAYYPYTPYPYPFVTPTALVPNPSSISSTSATSTSVTVVATTTTGGTAPIQYNFAVNGTYAGWQASQSHTFTGLTPSTSYAFKVKAQDSATIPLTTTESAVSNVSTTGTIPTVTAVNIPSAGTTTVVTLSASCTTGTGGIGGVTASASGGALTLTYSSGSASSTYTFTNSRTVLAGESVTLTYVQPGNGIEATTGGADLASFSGRSVTNSSTQVAATAPTVTAIAIPSAGTTTTLTMSQSATVGAGGSGGFTAVASGGALTLAYASGSPGTAYTLTNSRTVNAGETVQVTYVQPGNGIEGTVGGLDLASFSLRSVANGSTAGIPTTTPTPPAPDRIPKPKKKR